MAGGALLIGMLAIGLGAGLLLFLAVRAESNRPERMTRQDAERAARRDRRRGGHQNPEEDRTDRRR